MKYSRKLSIVLSLTFASVFTAAFPAAAEIKVYDNGNQYLGILIDMDSREPVAYQFVHSVNILVPSADAYFTIDWQEGAASPTGTLSALATPELWYTDGDCNTTPQYCSNFLFSQILHDGAVFFKTDVANGGPLIGFSNSTDFAGTLCTAEERAVPLDYCSPVVPVTVPFTMPIALPLHFKHTVAGDVNGDDEVGLAEAVNGLQKAAGARPN